MIDFVKVSEMFFEMQIDIHSLLQLYAAILVFDY